MKKTDKKGLSFAQSDLLAAIKKHPGWWPSSRVLAAECGWPRGGAARSAPPLIRAGLVEERDGGRLYAVESDDGQAGEDARGGRRTA